MKAGKAHSFRLVRTKPTRPLTPVEWAVVGAVTSLVNSSLTTSLFGYMGVISLPGNLTGAAMACYGFARYGMS